MLLSVPRPACGQTEAPDTVEIPLNIRIGAELAGHVIWLTDRNNFNTEGFISADLNEKYSIFAGGGYSDYKYSQYNYEYLSSGFFLKAGVDINFFGPAKSKGKYWAGVGLRYGISSFSSGVPVFEYENYWGSITSSIPPSDFIGHYLEASPGFRAEMFRNFTMGWSVNIRRLIHSGAGKDLRPIYIPGFGQGSENVGFGISYFLLWNIRWKTISVILKQELPEETEETQAAQVR